MVMSGTDAPKETMATENSHKHNRGRVEPPMKDTVRDDERHHREVRRVDKEHAIEVEERHAYEPDNGDERMEVEDKEPYGSTIRQQRTDEDQKDANNMDRGEQRRDVENGQQNHPSQENSGQDEIGLSRHDQYQYELHEGRHPDPPPSQAADNNLHLLQHDTYNSSQRLGHGPSLPPNQEPHHIKYNFHKTPGQSPCSSSFGSLSNPKPAVDSISFLHGVSDHDRSGPATAMFKPSPLPLTEQPQRKDNDVRQGKPALSKATADLRVELNKEGGSEQMLLMMLQSKNGEINSLKDEMLSLQELMGVKQSANDGLAQEMKRLEDLYKRSEQIWKTSISSAKKWRDTVKQKEMSKNQALKELKDIYEEQSQIYSETINSLSKELFAFREESMKKTKEAQTRNVQLEDEIKAKDEEFRLARNQILELQDKLKAFEETLAPNLERMMSDMIQNLTLQRESQETRFSRDDLDGQLGEAANHLRTLGCEAKNLKDMVQELERKHKEALQKSVAKTEAVANEWKHKLELADLRVASLEQSLSSVKADAHLFAQRSIQTEMDLKTDLAARSSESQARIDNLEKELKVAMGERDKAIRSLDETRAREQMLKDKITGLTQSSKESQLQLQDVQGLLQDARKQGYILEEQVKSLRKQLEFRSGKSEGAMLVNQKFDDYFKHLQNKLVELQSAQDQVTEENGRLKVENEERRQSGRELVERWERDELSAEEVVMVQKVTQQIRRGEQAIYRQELDEKSNAVKKLESRCKRLEAQISVLSRGKMISSLTTPSSLNTVHSSSDPPNRPSAKSPSSPLAPVAVSHKPIIESAVCLASVTNSNFTPANSKKRRLLNSQDVEDSEESFGHDEVVDGIFANVDEALLNQPHLIQGPTKLQKKTRFAETIEHSSPSPDSQPEDADDPIDPPTSQTQPNLHHLAPPPPSQVIKTYARNKGVMRARSSLENVMANSGNTSGATGHEKGTRKLRGGRKSY
ncbi:hypothetical protein I310_03961 [Cryptococcus deuterogattii CA1014]|nr:hypothetical protein I310_03961 [Cryptococcus deuterogattii CA1014]